LSPPRCLAGKAQETLPKIACALGLVQVMAQAFNRVGVVGGALMEHIEPNEHEVPKESISFRIAGRAVVIAKDVANGLQGVSFVSVGCAGLEVSQIGFYSLTCPRPIAYRYEGAACCFGHGSGNRADMINVFTKVWLLKCRPGSRDDFSKVCIRRGRADRELTLGLKAKARNAVVSTSTVNYQIVKRLAVSSLLHSDPHNDAVVKARGRFLSEQCAKINGNRSIFEGKPTSARYFRRLRHFNISMLETNSRTIRGVSGGHFCT
jgi:hypothetical protein